MKKAISLLLVMTLIICTPAFTFAGSEGEMEFTGAAIELSLEAAKKAMLTSGAAIEVANLTMRANKAKTKSHYEKQLDARILRDQAQPLLGEYKPTKVQVESIAYQAEFAREQTQRNYDAALNKIVRDTVAAYYGLAQAKEALRISNDNVSIQEKLYQNTQSKFNLGVMSKQDVLVAEVGLNDARVKAGDAEKKYNEARMGFNIAFGYDLMQNISITDTLGEATGSDIPLDRAIAMALENRNEICEAVFNLTLAEYGLQQLSGISKTSATYLEAAAGLLGAQTALANEPKQIEMDVRTKYMDMVQQKSAVELGKLSVANARETYRLANLQFDAGMITLTETQQAQVLAYQTELAYSKTLLDYNLAIIDYEQSVTVGTSGVKF